MKILIHRSVYGLVDEFFYVIENYFVMFLWRILVFIGVCVSAVVNLYCVAKGLIGLLLGAMLVCTIIWYRTQYMNYILLGIAEFMLVGVLAAGAFVLELVSEVRDCVGRFIIGG